MIAMKGLLYGSRHTDRKILPPQKPAIVVLIVENNGVLSPNGSNHNVRGDISRESMSKNHRAGSSLLPPYC